MKLKHEFWGNLININICKSGFENEYSLHQIIELFPPVYDWLQQQKQIILQYFNGSFIACLSIVLDHLVSIIIC